jgi:2-polyprenyl-6-methoxyphenol hydroxylase-like FAD-dependent oxidoreductase
LPAVPAHRAGTPQARHVHALLVSGLRSLGELFPDFELDLEQAGAVPLKGGLDVRIERPGYDPFPQRDLGWLSYAASRPTIEHVVRQRVKSIANVAVLQACRARELLANADGTAVTSVRYENADGTSETLRTDLVVDASGRGALTIGLLKTIGAPLPEESAIGVDLGYGTCVFDIPNDAPSDWKGVMTLDQAPQNSRGGLLLPLEGSRWMVTIGGRHGDAPPGDAEGFLAYARGLRTQTIYDAIKGAKRLEGVTRYGFPESMRRHFERLETFPHGFLPIADAIAASTPSTAKG